MTAPPLSPPRDRVACHGMVPVTVPRQESGSESDFELDSPPHLTIPEDQELDNSPTSPPDGTPPPSPPPSIGIERGPPVLSTFGYDIEEWLSSDDQEDPYFTSLVDNFVSASDDVCKSMLPAEDTIDDDVGNQRQSNRFAVSALKHYNSSENNKVKYELVDAIASCGMIDMNGCSGHVNFIAKANQKNSKEELFFAELRVDDDSFIATCVLSLEGEESVGGLCGSKYDNGKMGFHIDAKHCYACDHRLKHPKNGALYESGHVIGSGYYYGM